MWSPLSACLPLCWLFSLSICLLDGPLCHSATNGHCWASHFLNDTSSAQYSCPAVTHSLLSPFSFLPPVSTTSSHAQQWLPSRVWKKSSFLSIFSQYFPLNMPLDERTSSCLTHTCALPYITCHWLNDWLTVYDWSIVSPLIAAPSPTGRFVHSSFIPPTSLSLFLPLHTHPFLSF